MKFKATKRERICYAVSASAGAVMWIGVQLATGTFDGWADVVFPVGMGLIIVVAFVLGVWEPRWAWRWGFVPFVAQMVLALFTDGPAKVFPLGVCFFAVLSIIPVSMARLGGYAGRKWAARNTKTEGKAE